MKRKKDDQDERNEAVQDHCVTNPHVPPRRVWDLYSNRVLPFFALPERLRNSTGDVRTLDRLWAISHSWVDEEDRQTVDTAINGRQWGVPFPRRTSLSNVRIELLNLGAEYVWLDVLCLRQADESKDSGSNTRTNEWKLDVPTIGNIYSAPSRICVIYFNGLGLSLSVSPDLLKSDRHWFNRVWTLQELCDCWLPGGLTGSSTVYEGTLFTRLKKLRKTIEDAKYDAKKLWPIIRERHCTNDVDRIAGLTYLTPHSTLPVYVEKLNLLLKNLRPEFLTWLFLGCPHDLGDLSEGEKLQLVNREQLYTDSPGSFSQTVYMLRPCRILSSSNKAARREWQGEEETVELWFPPNTFARVKITVWGVVRPDVTYSFLGLGDLRYWILTTGAPEGERDGRLRVVEWGIAHMEAQQAQRLVARGLGRSKTEVVYDQKLRSDGESDPQVRSLRDLKGRRSSVQRLLEGMPLDLW
ncbi:uncharacterized protein PHACADRAFT_253498 [Phanerochaete carnosa HHB-10118-sp]|uniref:Uncharacterized protein n=1 Tax=Phanerochaete carnosa (strain HHB-10118-sp) TaxID=650164 RepID=K5V1N4_PHACS|nr:uncharacterized protein PHACADRAFT_253498 [Phanerochaete carnosa HHB-10118-sp]EKM56406.1 hypothetical protein PHACADRAFT_253498 [Phanerochaete carnosa HHB-10118-sp]